MSDESEELPNGRLVIYEVVKEDAGEYECFNPENGDTRRMRLVVLHSNGAADDQINTQQHDDSLQTEAVAQIESEPEVTQSQNESDQSVDVNNNSNERQQEPEQQPQQPQQPKQQKEEEKVKPQLKQIQSKYRAEVDAKLGESVEMYCEYKNEPVMKWRKVDGVAKFEFSLFTNLFEHIYLYNNSTLLT